jgi:hypothetical protein
MKKFLKSVLYYWKLFAKKLAAVQTAIILSIIYFLGVGIVAIFINLLRKDLLNKRSFKSANFWVNKEKDEITIERAHQQF